MTFRKYSWEISEEYDVCNITSLLKLNFEWMHKSLYKLCEHDKPDVSLHPLRILFFLPSIRITNRLTCLSGLYSYRSIEGKSIPRSAHGFCKLSNNNDTGFVQPKKGRQVKKCFLCFFSLFLTSF